MTGYEYEKKCAQLLRDTGYTNVKVTPGSGDQGIDVIAHKDGKKYGIQCKYYEGTVGNKAVQEAFAGAAYYDCDATMVITNSTLTAPAKTLAKKLNVQVMEGVDAVYLMEHDKAKPEQKRLSKFEALRASMMEELDESRRIAAQKAKTLMDPLLQWRNRYKATIPPIAERTQRKLEELERTSRRELAIQLETYEKKRKEIEEKQQALIAESDALRDTLDSQSVFTRIFKPTIIQQLLAQIESLRTAIDSCPNDIRAIEEAQEQAKKTAEATLQDRRYQIEQNFQNSAIASCPEPSGELYNVYIYLLWKKAWDTAEKESMRGLRPSFIREEQCEYIIWVILCSRKLCIYCYDLYELDIDVSGRSLAYRLERKGMITREFASYRACNLDHFFSIQKEVCAFLADCTEDDLSSALFLYKKFMENFGEVLNQLNQFR